ncbi:hypothetical protein LOTGIDRAFT_159923 [Lottia gigantea]|uniref:Uncharacterized protein n=1 Tax=Lottia gigantea TaxID=225164 RepID=V4AS18_LOTGI|nr:hypothetical protein LOTGIDRAFT_159923 [Lottia gigantea]ESO96506.1 hypothetical protein LOTGIDRAFT_159923 [Lottia gigantea]
MWICGFLCFVVVLNFRTVSSIKGEEKSVSRNSEISNNISNKRAAFTSWGGKRTLENILRQGKLAISDKEDQQNSQNIKDNKRAAFNSWGGKRTPADKNPIPTNIVTDKKAAFTSWGGKREAVVDSLDDKRAAFNSWGGKRIWNKNPLFRSWSRNVNKQPRFNSLKPFKGSHVISKRAAFAAWGGKRAPFSVWNGKRAAFTSWGGKRSNDEYDLDKKAFRYWNGKPSDLNDGGDGNVDMDKKAAFTSWGGKRSDFGDEMDKKSAFTSWGGKRSDYGDEVDKKAAFTSWGGKRSLYDLGLYDLNKRPAFSSWNGKRSLFPFHLSDNIPDPEFNENFRLLTKRKPEWNFAKNYLRAFVTRLLNERAPKRSFSAWKGKRNGELVYNVE